ncbi:MAG TPA: universal stress protein [Anaerolineae bacterium]|jgi:nucleotide-binding universal stress UspA family protein|nr:universal stress protein [Anaerolineae bacterium]
MKYIVCATRGGAGSRAVQERAIRYALEREIKLVFLFVIDVSTLDDADEKLRSAVLAEMTWLGQALLKIAHQRAQDAGIDSEIVIREGQVRDEICRFLDERSAEMLLLGAPRGTTATIFGDDIVEQFAAFVKEATGIPVEIVRPQQASNA